MSTTLFDEVRSGTAPSLVPITVEQFHLMIHNGIVLEGAPIELIDGLMVRKVLTTVENGGAGEDRGG